MGRRTCGIVSAMGEFMADNDVNKCESEQWMDQKGSAPVRVEEFNP